MPEIYYHLTLTGIPLEAHNYVVNGKSALEWLMERYQITVDKDSGIRNDPNDWMTEPPTSSTSSSASSA